MWKLGRLGFCPVLLGQSDATNLENNQLLCMYSFALNYFLLQKFPFSCDLIVEAFPTPSYWIWFVVETSKF